MAIMTLNGPTDLTIITFYD